MYLITGASEGLGFATAIDLLKRTTSEVMITGRSSRKLEAARAGAPAHSRQRLVTRQSDQSKRSDVETLVSKIKEMDDLQGAVLAVGMNTIWEQGSARRTHRVNPGDFERTITTNCTHTMFITAAVLDALSRRGGGVIIWIGSQAAAAGLPGSSVYCASKSFLSGLARSIHNEYTERGVRVHVAHPGIVRTPRTERVADSFARKHDLVVDEAPLVGSRIVDLVLSDSSAGIEMSL